MPEPYFDEKADNLRQFKRGDIPRRPTPVRPEISYILYYVIGPTSSFFRFYPRSARKGRQGGYFTRVDLLAASYYNKTQNEAKDRVLSMKKNQIRYRFIRRFLPFLLAGLLLLTGSGCAPDSAEHTESAYIMNTLVRITLPEDTPAAAYQAAFAEMARLEGLFSAQRPDSEIAKLNQARALSPLDPDTLDLLSVSLDYIRLTGGAFNPCMGALTELWGISGETPQVPGADEIDQALALCDPQALSLDGQGAAFQAAGVKLDLGAIAKGYAADRAARVLREQGITRGVISMGGNVVVLGEKQTDTPWRVGIRDPLGSADEIVGYLQASDLSVVTSGGYERYFEQDGVRYHHILDPATGYPADAGLISVTVVTADGTLADMLSTAVFVLGARQAETLIGQLDEPVQLILIDKQKRVTSLGDELCPFTFTAAGGGYRYEG